MSFQRRYLTWLIAPPAALSLPLALLFLRQVIQFSRGSWLTVVASMLITYGIAAAMFAWWLRKPIESVEESEGTERQSEAMSRCLERSESGSLALWLGGGATFAILGTMSTLPTPLGFSYFLVAALIAAAPSIAWIYFTAKNLLAGHAAGSRELHYSGRELSLGKKIAIVFIGFFIVSAAALVLMISSRVSTTLEILAINSSEERFERVFDSASLSARVDQNTLAILRDYLPADFVLFQVRTDRTVISSAANSKNTLDDDEIDAVLRLKNGNSAGFIAAHVMRFGQLKDGSVLVLSIPWAPYRNIPYQISFYTVVIALLTTLIFSVATFFLSRDVTAPLKELSLVAAEMAEGNFQREPHIFADDEVGRLGESFAATRRNLKGLIGRIGGSGSTITDGVRVITGGTDRLVSRTREQAEVTESATSALTNVRSSTGLVLSAAGTVSDLAQDAASRALELQASSEEIARSMDSLFQSVEKTSSSTTEMDASAREMSDRTNFLAATGEEVLSFVTQMDSTIGGLRESAESTAEISRKVREDAAEGGSAVNETVKGIVDAQNTTKHAAKVISELQASAGQITQILNVIEEITERTNLLSLNAAIIAAQAGEQGAGFTVVADEIRELADRTRGSTKEISGIIKRVQAGAREAVSAIQDGVDRVDENVGLAQNASQTLKKIVDSAARSYDMSTKISLALQEQATASRHLHEVTSKVSENITEINRATQEQARGTRLLAEEAERVREIALQVRTATEEQTVAGKGITVAMEQIASDTLRIRDLLENQLRETESIAAAATMMSTIAQQNDSIAQDFTSTVQNLARSARDFESEVSRFQLKD